ncbi:MAG: UbiA prenyltransferase family protein [bacterium]
MTAYISLIRPHHWVKNLFVLLPVPFALAAGVDLDEWPFIQGLLAFSLVNSAVYAFNDVIDRERDRCHPGKKNRPVAAGQISTRSALVTSFALILMAALLLMAALPTSNAGLNGRVLAIPSVYLLLNLIYSLWGRDVPVVDVLLLAAFFFLRILYGCALLGVPPSERLLVGGTGIALLLALGKRRGELRLDLAIRFRESLNWYTEKGMDRTIKALSFAVMLFYTEYCWHSSICQGESSIYQEERWWWSLPPMYGGVLYYLQRILVANDQRSPVELVLRSHWIQFLLICWAILTWLSLGSG